MLKKILKLFKRIVISAFILYGYNLIASPLNLMVPINIISVSILTILGIPALFALIIILVVIF